MHSVLLATLGAEPQVISLATELLLAQGTPLCAVVVIHTRRERAPIAGALAAVEASFAAQPAWPPLQTTLVPVDDVISPDELNRFADTLYAVVRGWLRAGVQVHLLLAGGRKSMAMVGMSVAQLLLGPADCVWYLYSDEELRRSGRGALAPGDQAQLVRIPLPRQAAAPPVYTRAFAAETPGAALSALEAEQAARVRYFLAQVLTPAERALARLVASEVLTAPELAARLGKAPKTVTNQLNTIYSKLESEFGLQADVGVKREFLRAIVGGQRTADSGLWERI